MTLSLSVRGSILRSFSRTLYIPVRVRSGMLGLAGLSVTVELFAEVAETFFERAFGEVGEGEGFEASADCCL